MIAAPVLIFSLTFVAAAFVSLLRRKHLVAALIAGIFATGMGLLVIFVPLDETLEFLGILLRVQGEWVILGRRFVINATNRNAIGFMYITGGFLLTGSWAAKPVRMFLPVGLGILFLVASSLMIVPFLFAAVLIEIAVISAALLLTPRRVGKSRGGMRLVIFYTFGMFALLLSGWAIDVGGITPDVSIISQRALLLLYFGLSVLLSIPPFHSWIPIASEETHPFAVGFIVLALQSAGLFLFIRFMIAFPWVWNDEANLSLLRTFGAILAVIGSLWAMVRANFSRLASYAIISDVGVMLIAIGFATEEGFRIALGLSVARAIGIACWAIGVTTEYSERNVREDMQVTHATGLSMLLKVTGLLTLAGIPLTAGFPSRWNLIRLSAAEGTPLWVAILVSMGIVGYTSLRRGLDYLTHRDQGREIPLGVSARVFLYGGMGVSLLLGVFPQVLYPWLFETVRGLVEIAP